MRLLKKILIWTLIAGIVEGIMFFSFDKLYAKPINNYNEVKSTSQVKKDDFNEISVTQNGGKVNISYDGKYVSYCEDKMLKVFNTKDKSNNDVDLTSNSTICYSKWLPDSNLLLVCEKDNKTISLFSYDADKSSKKELIGFDTEPIKIKLDNSNDTVDNIALSTSNHVMYIKVLSKTGESEIYQINVNGDLGKLQTSDNVIGNTCMVPHDDKLIYEDMESGELKMLSVSTVEKNGKTKNTTKTSNIEVNDGSEKVLLGTDSDDKIYVGIMENNKISAIFYGDSKTKSDQWKTLKLQELTDKNNIIITQEGNMYINQQSKASVKNVASNAETKYSGTFAEIKGKYVYSISNGKVSRIALK